MREVYLDNAATTKVLPEIATAMAKTMCSIRCAKGQLLPMAKCSCSCGTCSIESVAFKIVEGFCSKNLNL